MLSLRHEEYGLSLALLQAVPYRLERQNDIRKVFLRRGVMGTGGRGSDGGAVGVGVREEMGVAAEPYVPPEKST